jgi:hypothetical protein
MMTSLLHQLENNEAILLMYLADELSAEDRADVEQQLATDASLRGELERLRALHDETVTGLQGLDAHSRLPVSEHVAVRRATRMMRQWQIDHLNAPPPEEPIKELRFPWWSYPLTTAAAVLIAFLVWWGNRGERVEVARPNYNYDNVANGPVDYEGWQSDMIASELQDSFDVSDEELMRMAANEQLDEAVEQLTSSSSSSSSTTAQPNEL